MTSDPRTSSVAAYYDRLVDQYGYSPLACDVVHRESLVKRYEVLSSVQNLDGCRVLEVGCGFGDLGCYLAGRYRAVSYVGIDISPRMIAVGRQVHPMLDLRHADVLDLEVSAAFDVVLAQGIFYLLGADGESRMRALISRMYALAREAVGFCTLSAWAAERDPGEFHADPVGTLQFCRTLTDRVTLRHDYLPNDFTLYLYKPPTSHDEATR